MENNNNINNNKTIYIINPPIYSELDIISAKESTSDSSCQLDNKFKRICVKTKRTIPVVSFNKPVEVKFAIKNKFKTYGFDQRKKEEYLKQEIERLRISLEQKNNEINSLKSGEGQNSVRTEQNIESIQIPIKNEEIPETKPEIIEKKLPSQEEIDEFITKQLQEASKVNMETLGKLSSEISKELNERIMIYSASIPKYTTPYINYDQIINGLANEVIKSHEAMLRSVYTYTNNEEHLKKICDGINCERFLKLVILSDAKKNYENYTKQFTSYISNVQYSQLPQFTQQIATNMAIGYQNLPQNSFQQQINCQQQQTIVEEEATKKESINNIKDENSETKKDIAKEKEEKELKSLVVSSIKDNKAKVKIEKDVPTKKQDINSENKKTVLEKKIPIQEKSQSRTQTNVIEQKTTEILKENNKKQPEAINNQNIKKNETIVEVTKIKKENDKQKSQETKTPIQQNKNQIEVIKTSNVTETKKNTNTKTKKEPIKKEPIELLWWYKDDILNTDKGPYNQIEMYRLYNKQLINDSTYVRLNHENQFFRISERFTDEYCKTRQIFVGEPPVAPNKPIEYKKVITDIRTVVDAETLKKYNEDKKKVECINVIPVIKKVKSPFEREYKPVYLSPEQRQKLMTQKHSNPQQKKKQSKPRAIDLHELLNKNQKK